MIILLDSVKQDVAFVNLHLFILPDSDVDKLCILKILLGFINENRNRVIFINDDFNFITHVDDRILCTKPLNDGSLDGSSDCRTQLTL